MARCGCSGQAPSTLVAGLNMDIDGVGLPDDPYILSATSVIEAAPSGGGGAPGPEGPAGPAGGGPVAAARFEDPRPNPAYGSGGIRPSELNTDAVVGDPSCWVYNGTFGVQFTVEGWYQASADGHVYGLNDGDELSLEVILHVADWFGEVIGFGTAKETGSGPGGSDVWLSATSTVFYAHVNDYVEMSVNTVNLNSSTSVIERCGINVVRFMNAIDITGGGGGGGASNVVTGGQDDPSHFSVSVTSTELGSGNSYAGGTQSVAIGRSSTADDRGVAIGYDSGARGLNSIAVGRESFADGQSAISIGYGHATDDDTVSVGTAFARGNSSVAIGNFADAEVGDTVAIGHSSSATGTQGVAVGPSTLATDNYAVNVGSCSDGTKGAHGRSSVAVGADAKTTSGAYQAVALGRIADAEGSGAIAIGPALAQSDQDIAIGVDAQATGGDCVAVGNAALAIGNSSVAAGRDSHGFELGSIAIGASAYVDVDADYGVALGYNASVRLGAFASIAIGQKASARALGTVAIGCDSGGIGASTFNDNDFALGTNNHNVMIAGRLTVAQRTPSGSADSQGQVGDITTDGNYVYVKTTAGWKRAPLSLVGSPATAPQIAPFSSSGVVAVKVGGARYYVEQAMSISTVRVSVGTAPTGAAILVDVNKNGTTIYTTQANRPQIAVSTNTATGNSPNVTTLAAGDYLTVDIDQVGSTVAGSDLTVQIGLI